MTFTLDGRRSLPIEVQSLVTKSVLPTPRRAANGVDANRIAMLVAVLYRHGNVNLFGERSVYFHHRRRPGARARMRSGDRRRVGERREVEGDWPHHVCDWRDFVDRAGASGAAIGIPVARSRPSWLHHRCSADISCREIAIPGLSIVQVDTLQDALGAMLR